ncbi:hypothetical protein ACFW04_012820 [Cataglyphis niger]
MVNAVSRYLSKHNNNHWLTVKRIFKYLIGTFDLGIEYRSGGSRLELIGYSDANYANDIEIKTSTTGYMQKSVAQSTSESEYVAAEAAKEAAKARSYMCYKANKESGVSQTYKAHRRLIHYMRERVEGDELSSEYVATEVQLADIFTKALPSVRFKTLCSNLGLMYPKKRLTGSVRI